MSSYKVIISGGGTGGHIFPAISIANAIKEHRRDAEILFVGAKGKMEMEKVPEAGYEIIGLPIRGIQRKLDLSNLGVPFLLLQSIYLSFKTLRKFKPNAVVGVGGYASAAVVFAASLMGIKTIIQEQNSYPGVTNKILGKMVNVVCVAFEGMQKYFPEKKIKLLGNPIRQDIISGFNKKTEAIDHFNLNPNKKTLLAVGGSLGARTINNCVKSIFSLVQNHHLQIVWQCGKFEFEKLKKELDENSVSGVHLHQFIKEMDLAYACADLMISRAGAISISEITALGIPSVLIPSPNVAEDHQTKNARALSEEGAALLLKDHEASDKIKDVIESLLQDQYKLEDIKQKLKSVYSNTNAARDIASEINQLITEQ